MGECHLDDLLDILDDDDDFEENVQGTVSKNEEDEPSVSQSPSTVLKTDVKEVCNVSAEGDSDPEKEALRRKLQEMEEQMRQIKSQLAPAPEEKQKTVREVDMFASGGNNVDSKHLRSPVKVMLLILSDDYITYAPSKPCHNMNVTSRCRPIH